jgi:hypothetical protein
MASPQAGLTEISLGYMRIRRQTTDITLEKIPANRKCARKSARQSIF